MRAIFQWKIGSRVLELGRHTLIMGVVNVTPDSFSDGGLHFDAGKAVAYAEQLLDEGQPLLTSRGIDPARRERNGCRRSDGRRCAAVQAAPVSEEEERKRVVPVIRDLKKAASAGGH